MMDANKETDVTATGASETPEPAVGGGSPQRSSSTSQNPVGRVPSMALSAGKATAETAVSDDTQRKQEQYGDMNTDEAVTSGITHVPTDQKHGNSSLKAKLLRSNSQRAKEPSLTTATSSLKNSMKQQNKIISDLLDAIDQLIIVKEKTKSPQVKEAIEAVTGLAEKLNSNRTSLHNAFFEIEKAVTEKKLADPQPKQSSNSQDKQEAILKACEALAVSLARQQEDINVLKSNHSTPKPSYASKAKTHHGPQTTTDLTSGLRPQEQPDSPAQSWTKVERKNANKTRNVVTTENGGTSVRGKSRRPPPDSIAVKPGSGETNHDILKTIKENVNLESIGAHVSSITESRNGEILFKLSSGDKKKTELMDELRTKLGSRAVIRSPVKYDDINILDLDCITTESDVAESIRHALELAPDDPTVKVKNIWKSFAGTQRATVKLKSTDALHLAKVGRVKVGWINARVKLKPTAPRCFRCLGYGHTKHSCKGPDRSDVCSLCISAGHKAADCKSPPKCAACNDLKEKSDHFPGSGKCSAYRAAIIANNRTTSAGSKDPTKDKDLPLQSLQ